MFILALHFSDWSRCFRDNLPRKPRTCCWRHRSSKSTRRACESWRRTSFGIGRGRTMPATHPKCRFCALSTCQYCAALSESLGPPIGQCGASREAPRSWGLEFHEWQAAMGRSTATSPIARWQCRRSAQHGIAGPHIKNETAEPWGRAGGLAHFWIGDREFGGWGRPYPVSLIYRRRRSARYCP